MDPLRDAQTDPQAFEALFLPHVPTLRGVLRRMVGTPDDVEDLTQQTLLNAFEHIESFRGDAKASTWLCAIGTRLAIDHLRSKQRWRSRAQVIFAASCLEDAHAATAVGTAMSAPDFQYDVREHIAYCFTCVGRTLPPDEQAALILRDVLGLTNQEAADALRVSRSILRHKLSAARRTMNVVYEELCALVKKDGICWQCAGLREASPDGKKGPPVPAELSWDERLGVVRETTTSKSAAMHHVFFRRTAEQEEERRGDENATTDCGRPET
ncbi:MAG: RNA polymerase sigma factor [Myxococcota bacterium]